MTRSIAPVMTDAEIKQFLFDHVKKSIDGDIKPLLADDNAIGGFFAVPALVFTLIEYLARLRYNNPREVRVRGRASGSEHSVWWIRNYMGRCNKRYKKIGGLLYDMFRHGTVHLRQPKQYLFSTNLGFGWEIVKNERPEQHLLIRNGRTLVLSMNQLVADLETSIDYFWQDIQSSPVVKKKFTKAYLKIKEPQWMTILLANKRYLTNDIQFIKKELKPW